ncbi:penicillin-binding protein 2 [Hydrogenophaga sp. 5NK40-0174]|uniref:peptidoglycan D,D-transpeptidase FtsI family protein n=1 Tax=Hydrogenophaga sp. 5NK40-0174 TaxID=3127649 RepID=UPI003106A0D8
MSGKRANASSRGAARASGRLSINYGASPLLASKTPVWRSKLIVAGLALAFAGLAGRAAYVQVFGNDFFQRQGEVRYARTLELPAHRGRILDRNGLLMASSVEAQSIWAIPEDVDKAEPKLKELAKLLGIQYSRLKKRLADEDRTFVWIKRQVDAPLAKQIAELDIKGIYQTREYKREYPEGEAAAHVIGFTNVEDKGQEGIELTFNSKLAGKNGSRRVIKDRLGRVIEDLRDVVPPVDGPDIQLSIDTKIQYFAYQKLKSAVLAHRAKAGSVLVIDTISGEVLALANYPSYDPNHRQSLTGNQLRNRVLTDSFEPGSTMKPFTIALALESGMVKPSTTVFTSPGWIKVGRNVIRDAHRNDALTVAEVIQKSSNVGTVKLAMRMPAREMWEVFAQVGFGQKPQVPFPGAVSGRLRPYKTWKPIEQATMSYGYGLSVSLFQLARAYTVFARDGEIIPLTMVKRDEPAQGVRVFSEDTARSVRHMLELATRKGGTAPKAQTMGYSVGGKTGTAHKVEGKGYAAKRYRSWFVGLAPVENPRIVVAVMVDEPRNGEYYGGLVAAPVFSETVQQTLRILGVQPDMSVTPQIVAETVEESF